MRFPPGGDALVVVAIGNRSADHQQQHFRQRMRYPPGLSRVLDLPEVIQQRPKAGLLTRLRYLQFHRGSSESVAIQGITIRTSRK